MTQGLTFGNPAQAEEQIFGHVQSLYGHQPEFGAAAAPVRKLVSWFVRNAGTLTAQPKILSLVTGVIAAAFPGAAWVAELAPLLAEIGPVIAMIQKANAPASGQPVVTDQPAPAGAEQSPPGSVL